MGRVNRGSAAQPGAILRSMKIGQWENLGRARELLQLQLGQLGCLEYASHVTVNPDSKRLRVLVATDVGLLDYNYAPVGGGPDSDWILRGQATRWGNVRGLRLVTDAQLDEGAGTTRSVWRFVSEEPKIELAATSDWSSQRRDEFARDLMAATPRSPDGGYWLPFGALYLTATSGET